MFSFLKRFSKHNFIDETREEQIKDIEKCPKIFWDEILSGEDCDQLSNSSGNFGRTFTNPIPVNGIVGEIKYLNRLRCACGSGLLFHRLGSTESDKIKNPIDIFETVCINGKHWDILYIHYYHPRRSKIVPQGYSFSEFHSIYSKFLFGFGTNKTVKNFPFEMSEILAGYLGGTMGERIAKIYEKYVKDVSKFRKPQEHLNKFEEILRHIK